ncbi:MAG: choline ABC transporter ATP-binding protein [Pseudomonadota bacterium]
MTEPIVALDKVSVVFGDSPNAALPLMDAGQDRAEIETATGQIMGVHDCSLSVARGEILVLMGLSGSGKSTLIRAVNGLNPIVRGSATLADGDWRCRIPGASARDLQRLRRECVSMVFQQFALLPWRTVRENVAFGLELRGMAPAERDKTAMAQLELVGLTAWADRQVHELSGGMQQRVGLARAFATDAPVLLMDEPFSALDPLIRARLQDELLAFQAQMGRTILFVSHDLDEAMKLGTRIAIMEGGRIVQLGTPQEIVLQPATAYVADFVAHMNPLNVLRAREVMGQGPVPADAPEIPVTMPVREIMAMLMTQAGPFAVMDAGQGVGRIDQTDVTRALLGLSDAAGKAGPNGAS